MKCRITILICTLYSVLCTMNAQDFARLSERSIMGTARYVGMSGAMTAIGGDPSSVLDNAAGLGLYRRTEVMVTADQMIDRTRQLGAKQSLQRLQFMVPQVSVVLSVPTSNLSSGGVQFHNFMFSYQRLQTFRRSMFGESTREPSLGALLAGSEVNWDLPFCADRYNATNSLSLVESGYVNDYAFHWAMNTADRWYLGAGLNIYSWTLISEGKYMEYFDTRNTRGVAYSNLNSTYILFSGAAAAFSLGTILRPTSWLRFGLGLQTPSFGSLTTATYGTIEAQTDSLRYSDSPTCRSVDKSFHMPFHISTSVAFQFGAYGMLSMQYDCFHQQKLNAMHSLRAGIEVIPVLGLYINAGYAYESTFARTTQVVPMDPSFDRQDTYFLTPRWSQYASVGVGYRGTHMLAQLAYQYRWQRIDLFAHELMSPYEMNTQTHRIVLTLGWHRN